MSKLIVAKFGGTSMADANAMKRSSAIALKRGAQVVVVSATSGTTNQLIAISKAAISGEKAEVETLLANMKERHRQIAFDLKASEAVFNEVGLLMDEAQTMAQGMLLLRECSPKAYDRLLSIGERVSSVLCSEAMRNLALEQKLDKRVLCFDIRKVMITDDSFGKADPQIETIHKLCQKHLMDAKYGNAIFVTQGFIGATESGETTTLGRGGSDYSATLIGEGLRADVVEIWTDVAGIATTDPRMTKAARPIKEITFKEAAELAIFGAKVLHPTTLAPAMRQGIEVFVGSSYEPDAAGTWIRSTTDSAPLIRAMAIKKDQSLLTLTTPKMLHGHGFLFNIFKIFNSHKISVDSITTSEISVALTVDDSTLLNKALFTELSQFADLKIEENLTLVSLIGNNINHTPGLGRLVFEALAPDSPEEKHINVRMICLGASKHNFCFLVNEDDAAPAISRLHKTFIENQVGDAPMSVEGRA